MDAKEFIRTHKRICKKYGNACEGCPLLDKGCYSTSTSIILPEELDENVVDFVEKWAKKNPAKTRQSKFLEQFPNARIIDCTLSICPYDLGLIGECKGEFGKLCCECRKDFWSKEAE